MPFRICATCDIGEAGFDVLRLRGYVTQDNEAIAPHGATATQVCSGFFIGLPLLRVKNTTAPRLDDLGDLDQRTSRLSARPLL
jgi:hypothetical protein